MKYYHVEDKLKAGEYLFEAHLPMLSVLEKLVKGDVVYHKITIPEGYTSGQIRFLLEEAKDLS